MISNLSQLKKAIKNGACFQIVAHYIKPLYTGQIRKPNVIQTNGFYSVIFNDPDNEVSKANRGKGSWIEYGKASDWIFADGLCYQTRMFNGESRKVWTIQVFEDGVPAELMEGAL